MNDRLYRQVCRKLNITWSDDDTKSRVEDIINSAIPYLIHKLGITETDFDFSVSGIENELFLNRCLYEYNHSLNEYEANYANELGIAQSIHAVKNYKSEVSTDEQA